MIDHQSVIDELVKSMIDLESVTSVLPRETLTTVGRTHSFSITLE